MTASNGHSEWQKALGRELKTDDVDRFLRRRLREGVSWPLLATQAPNWAAPSGGPAALSHTWVREPRLTEVAELAALGVWDFIYDPFLLGHDAEASRRFLTSWPESEARLWVLGEGQLPKGAQRVLHVTQVWARGGHAVHELAGLLHQVISWAQAPDPVPVGVALTMDREFFKSIAKARALKALVQSALGELGRGDLWPRLTWIARSSWRDFTALDPASNILRNATAMAAGYVTGAQVVESLPHDMLLSRPDAAAAHLARAGQLVLQQEAGLGEVADAGEGAYALEDMTRQLGEAAWTVMQKLADQARPLEWLAEQASSSWQEVTRAMRTRRLVQAGVNDFPVAGATVELHDRFLRADHVRVATEFEALRRRAQAGAPLNIALVVAGDWAGLQARLNFARNLFELAGATVVDPGRALESAEAPSWLGAQATPVWVWIAADGVAPFLPAGPGRAYVAGKQQVEDFLPLYSGMDVVELLEELLAWRESQS